MMGITNSIVSIVCNSTLQLYGGDLYIAIMTIILSIVVTAVATMLPVRTAVKVEPAIVLRGE